MQIVRVQMRHVDAAWRLIVQQAERMFHPTRSLENGSLETLCSPTYVLHAGPCANPPPVPSPSVSPAETSKLEQV